MSLVEVAAGSTLPPYLSPSSIATFRQCPLLYKLTRIDGLSDGETTDMLRGTFVHEVLENLFMLEPEYRTPEQSKVIMRDLWEKQWNEKMGTHFGDDPKAIRQFRWESWWRMENYFSIEDPTSVFPEGLETAINGEVGGVLVRGFIDRWSKENGRLVVTDYKTGKTPQARFRSDKFTQLMIYADFLAEQESCEIERVELLFLKDGGRITSPANETQIKKMREVVQETRVGIDLRFESAIFEPKTSKLCDWCNFKNECPAYKK